MRTRRRVLAGVGWLAWVWLGLGPAQAGDLLPVATPAAPLGSFPFAVRSPSPVTLELRQGGADVTAGYRPVPGSAVQVVVKVNGVVQSPAPSMALVPPQVPAPAYDGVTNPFLNATTPLGTSAYRGQCGNTENPAPMPADAPDYEFTGPDILTPTDCGGFAVLQVTIGSAPVGVPTGTYTFVVPQDGDPAYPAADPRHSNGIPFDWEAQFCPSSFPCPTGREDTDVTAGVTPAVAGDLRSALDEYRGTMVGGVLRRTDPRRKDLFLFRVGPQCTGQPPGPVTDSSVAALARLGGGLVTYPRPVDGGLFDAVATLAGSDQTHVLAAQAFAGQQPGTAWRSAEMVDAFERYEVGTGVVLTAGGAADDRWVARNAVYPFPRKPKAVRVIECVAPATTPFLPPAQASIAGSLEPEAYVVLNTYKMIKVVEDRIAAGGSKPLKLSTYAGNKWTRPQAVGPTLAETLAGTGTGDPAVQAHRDVLHGQYFKRVVAHEVGHTGSLEPPGTGHASDYSGLYLASGITANVTSSANVFYIESLPESYTTTDRANFAYAPPP